MLVVADLIVFPVMLASYYIHKVYYYVWRVRRIRDLTKPGGQELGRSRQVIKSKY